MARLDIPVDPILPLFVALAKKDALFALRATEMFKREPFIYHNGAIHLNDDILDLFYEHFEMIKI